MIVLHNLLRSPHIRNLVKGSFIVFSGSMLMNFFSYLYHLIVGRLLGPEKYAELASLLAILYIANVPTDSLRTILVKYFATLKAKNDLQESVSFFWTVTRILVVFSLIGFIVLVPFVPFLMSYLHIQNNIQFYALYAIFATGFISITNISYLLGYQRFFETMVYGNISAILRLGSSVVAPIYQVVGLLIATSIVNIISYGSYFFSLRKYILGTSKKFNISKKTIASYSLPVVLATFGLTLLYNQDVVLVKHFFSAQQAGLYSALSVLGKIIYFASYAIGTVSFPIIAERHAIGSSYAKLVLMSLGSAAAICGAVVCIYFLLPGLMIRLLFGPSYLPAASYVGIFGIFLSFFSLSTILTNVNLALGRTRIWIFPVAFAIIQQVLISVFHTSLMDVIVINSGITVSLFIILGMFFIYEEKFS